MQVKDPAYKCWIIQTIDAYNRLNPGIIEINHLKYEFGFDR